ncbi:MAG TPA: hypothetical protein VGO11_04005 [Chthoniobacteraceae bacterium]|jgi:hypothetical protein|nr:hypothetical protein [Chthoniobacteraceae bacterium]
MKLEFVALASFLFCWPAVADESISDLPKHIVAPPGEITLVADFDHSTKTNATPWSTESLEIPVYLINRSGKKLELEAQDGDVYLKLEYRNSNGDWKRAQPHQYSWCGNSYFMSPSIAPERFMVIKGYEPSHGDEGPIRFRLYEQTIEVASNVGKGLVSREDIHKAENDAMAIRTGDLAFVASVARGERILQNTSDHIKGPELRRTAMFALTSGRFDETQVRVVLKQIVDSKEEPFSGWATNDLFQLDQKAAVKAGR